MEQRLQRAEPHRIGGGKAGDVDREAVDGAGGELGHGELQHVPVHLAHQAELLDHRHEGRRRNELAIVGTEAHQALVERRLVRDRLDDRLEREGEPILGDRPLDFGGDRLAAAMQEVLLLGRTIGREAVAALALGLAKRGFGAGHHVLRGLARAREENAADRDGHMDARVVDRHGHFAHGLQHALGRLLHLLHAGTRQKHAETVGADAPDHVGRANQMVEPLAEGDQHAIAGFVAEGVVDL